MIRRPPSALRLAAVLLYATAGHDPAKPPGAGALALRLLGIRGMRQTDDPELLPGQPRLCPDKGRWLMSVRRASAPWLANLSIARSLALWAEAMRLVPPEIARDESFVDELLIPAPAFFAASRFDGFNDLQIADRFVAPIEVVQRRRRELIGASESGEYVRVLPPKMPPSVA